MSEANNITIKTITISGLDGSGKSTQINLLKKYLESQGKRTFYFHAVNFSIGNKLTNSFNLFRKKYIISRSRDNVSKNCSQNHSERSVTNANWLQIQLRKIALRVDIWRFKKLIKKLEKQGYDYILSDRFFYDTIINITYLESKNLKIVNCKLIENCKLKIVNFTSFYLQTSPQNIMNRDRVPEQGLEYLKDKKKLYDQYFENFPQAKIINGNKSKEEIFEEIKTATNRISD